MRHDKRHYPWLFKKFVLSNFPYIEEDFDALTNYQLRAQLVAFVRKMGIQVADLTALVKEFQEYFATLDIQDEVDKKIEEMAEGGELVEIISEYLNTKAELAFSTLADLKEADNLINGSLVETYGRDSVGDGGGARYLVRNILNTDVIDDASIVQLADNTLIAQLIPINETVSAKQFGLSPDGTTDNSEKLQTMLDKYKHIYLEDGIYLSNSALSIPSDRIIDGSGTIKGNLQLTGTLGETITYSNITANQITSSEEFTGNELIIVYLLDTETPANSKRQINKITSSDGRLGSNLVNYSASYTVQKLNSIHNVIIKDITINGTINITYGENILISGIYKEYGRININSSYNVTIDNTLVKYANLGDRIDVNSGSSCIKIHNLTTEGGSTESDNGALKINEGFYCTIDSVNIGSPNESTGTYHGLMIDGDYAESGYPFNPSFGINITNLNVANGYYYGIFATLAYKLSIVNANIGGNTITVKNCRNVNINTLNAENFYLNEIEDGETINISNSSINLLNSGSRRYMNFVNSHLGTVVLIQASRFLNFVNCEIDSFRNSYVSANSAQYINFSNTLINNTCELSGLRSSHIDVLARCRVNIRSLRDSIVNLSIIDNVNNDSTNIALYNSDQYNYITYSIAESALATTPVQMEGGATANEFGLTNTIVCARMLKANNNNATYTQNFTKFSSVPADGQHYVGEVILNNQPSNGIFAWVCTASGTPGTWKKIVLESI